MKIAFIENSGLIFDYNDLDSNNIRGTEKALINIAIKLSEKFDVFVFNNCNKSSKKNNLYWHNINEIKKYNNFDVVISFSDANLFYKLSGTKNYLWSHSVQNFEKFIRKKQLFPILKFKPILILEGEYHFKNRSFFTAPYGKIIIKLAADDLFFDININQNYIPEKKAIFTTRSDRNLNFLLNCWKDIKLNSETAKLYINPPYELSIDNKKNDVILRNAGDRIDLIKDLITSRCMLIPGHKGEVFCLAAEEANVLCLPIITMGIGSLYERVIHGQTGYVAKNKDEFVKFSLEVLNNDTEYLRLKKNLIKNRLSRTYKNVISDLVDKLNLL